MSTSSSVRVLFNIEELYFLLHPKPTFKLTRDAFILSVWSSYSVFITNVVADHQTPFEDVCVEITQEQSRCSDWPSNHRKQTTSLSVRFVKTAALPRCIIVEK